MKKDKEIFEKVYENSGEAIWTNSEPPEELKELVESGKLKPCKVLDVGCGEGFYSIYLAKKGFDVTGIDISENAIRYAKKNTKKEGVNVRFIAMDLVKLSELEDKFDFILEWTIMHHIRFEDRQKYVKNIAELLNKGGKYFSICFNEKDVKFGKSGEKVRIVPKNSKIPAEIKHYLSSLEELGNLFSPYFEIIESKVIEKKGVGFSVNTLNYFFMEKK